VQGTGVGSALRKARLLRGKSIEEASRETRIRADYLQALERERFDALLGDVYVRGCLRSYSSYLGLDPKRVITMYSHEFGEARVARPQAPVAAAGPPLGLPADQPHFPRLPHLPQLWRHSLTWPLLIAVALSILAALGAVGLLSRSKAPAAGAPAQAQGSIPVLPPAVTVDIQAQSSVTVVVRIDGGSAQRYSLRKGEGRSFEGSSRIDILLDHGGAAVIVVNGHSLGLAGKLGTPFVATFGPQDFRATAKPSPSNRSRPSPPKTPARSPSGSTRP
jgi:cytoskeleton protein RodZ